MRFSKQTRIGEPRHTVSRTLSRRARLQDWLQPKVRLLPVWSSHVVSCGFAISPIMPSTASAAMKPLLAPSRADPLCARQFGSPQATGENAAFLFWQ